MNKAYQLQVLDIIRGTTVDGPGFRTSIYLAGCTHQCPGCHNPQSWDPSAGTTMNIEEIMNIILEEDFDVTLTGGDPLFDPLSTLLLVKAIKNAGYGIWLYTGYTIEEIHQRKDLMEIIQYCDAVVEGRFIQELKDSDLLFRGSSNQRIIRPNS